MRRLFSVLLCVVCVFNFVACADDSTTVELKSMTRNEGLANIETTINMGKEGETSTSFDASEVVPTKEILIDNLQKNGYMITMYDKALNRDVEAERVYAEKDGKVIDICYGLTTAEAKVVFEAYEAHYTDFYVIAQNQEYVYFVADKETFDSAGFTSLANDGIQLICE